MRNKNRSQINELLSDIQFIKTKMLHAAMKTIWAQKWKLLPVAKIKGKKRALDGVLL